jgi:hypothetical protein
MADSLSRSEVESLLSALDPKSLGEKSPPPEPSSDRPRFPDVDSRSSSSLARSAVLFCESVRKRIEVTWESLLGTPVRLKRHMPGTYSFAELVERRISTHVGLLLESTLEQGDLILLIERTLIGELLARMLGNSGGERSRDRLSELEMILLQRLARECFVQPLPFRGWTIRGVEPFDPLAERAARTDQTLWWMESWELKMDSIRGNVQLAGEWRFVSGSGTASASPGNSEPESEPRHRVWSGESFHSERQSPERPRFNAPSANRDDTQSAGREE